MSWLFNRYPYSCVLDYKPGFFLSWLLYRLFKRVQIDENISSKLKQLQREGTVVYAIKYRGHLDYLLYHFRLRRGRLPYPRVAFDLNMAFFVPLRNLFKILKSHLTRIIRREHKPSPLEAGLYNEALKKGVPLLLCLIDPGRFKRQFLHEEIDPIEFLVETQKTMEKPIFLVPTLVLYKRSPEKAGHGLKEILFGYRDNPGPIRKIFLFFRYYRKAFIDFGDVINLKSFVQLHLNGEKTPSEMGKEIRDTLIESIDIQKRIILGPIVKPRQLVKERVLNDPMVLEAIERLSGGDPKDKVQLKQKAGEFFEEIASDYSPTYVAIARLILRFLWNKLFEGIDLEPTQLSRLREWARKGPVIFVPSHKSHIDYLVLNYILFEYYIHLPRIAAGQNLAFWPMGHIFRKCGAFFIRRTFSGARLYAKVFSAYVYSLLEEGYSIQFYIEGGRSRSGKLVLPKTGLLSILLDGYKSGVCRDLVFVPVSIVYDRVPEEKSYILEQEGVPKERESFKQFLKTRHFLKKKYGKIYIRVAQPFSFRQYLGDADGKEINIEHRLALDLVDSINRVTLVTPLSLVACALLTKHRRGFRYGELAITVKELVSYLQRKNAPTATSLNDLENTLRETINLLISWKMLEEIKEAGSKESYYSLDEEKKRELEYYKNSIVHFFVPASFVACSLLSAPHEFVDTKQVEKDYDFLMHVFKNEFIFHTHTNTRKEIQDVLSFFLSSEILKESERTQDMILTKKGYEKLPIWAGLIKTFIEAYWIAAKTLLEAEEKRKKRAELLKRMKALGAKFLESGLIDHMEAISLITFKNALSFLHEEYILAASKANLEESELMEEISRMAERLYSYSRFDKTYH